jgi:hypothetical protein
VTRPATRRTARFFAGLLLGGGVLLAPGLVWPAYLDSPVGIVLLLPFLSVYLFHAAGVPGLLEHGGACGWGWCAPTLAGWALIVAVGLGALWLLAALLARLFPEPPR